MDTGPDAGGEGESDDSYLDEHFHVHERLGQDGETGAQEHLTGRVRHDGTRGRTDRQTESPSATAGSRSRVRGAGFTGPPAARPPAQAPPTAPPKETAGAREGPPGAGLMGGARMRLGEGSARRYNRRFLLRLRRPEVSGRSSEGLVMK